MSSKKEESDQGSSEINESTNQKEEAKTCGLIMPLAPMISSSEMYTSKHWEEVKAIVTETLVNLGFECKMVSEEDVSGSIHTRIVTNIYKNDLVICDVSGRNANVMFELGLRLAFDKPVIIIKDELTPFSFDTQSIEHIPYPSGLHYFEIKEFRQRLERVVNATYKESRNPEYSPFLKDFQIIKRKTILETEVSDTQFILKAIQDLKEEVKSVQQGSQLTTRGSIGSTYYSKGKFNKFLSLLNDLSKIHSMSELDILISENGDFLEGLIEDFLRDNKHSKPFPENLGNQIIEYCEKKFNTQIALPLRGKFLHIIEIFLNKI